MLKTFSILSVLLIISINLFSQEITNIRFEQEGKMINIFYDLKGTDTYEVKVYCSQDGGTIWGNLLSKVTGEVGVSQKSGNNKMITWDVLAEKEKLEGNIAFRIDAFLNDKTGSFIDRRDGKTYKFAKIGEQTWMAENLNFETTSGSWCYDNKLTNCDTYGRLYDWETAIMACPIGWHLPTDAEWTVLSIFLGNESEAGGKMKESGTLHWISPNFGATNLSSFTALPGGYHLKRSVFRYISYNGTFWSSTEDLATTAWSRTLFFDSNDLFRSSYTKKTGFSIRCVKD